MTVSKSLPDAVLRIGVTSTLTARHKDMHALANFGKMKE
jgi:hypothetical protein